MLMPGAFAVSGLLLLALHFARPDLLNRLVETDARLSCLVPGVPAEALDIDGRFQRVYRRIAVASISGWTLVNLALFALAYVVPFPR